MFGAKISDMNVELMQALADLEKEKGVKKDYMLERIAQALAAAYKIGRAHV